MKCPLYSQYSSYLKLVKLGSWFPRVFSSMLGKAGERVPAACKHLSKHPPLRISTLTPWISPNTDRCKRLLFDVLVQTCGEQFADPPRADSPNTYIAPADSALIDRMPSRDLFGLAAASATTVTYA
jgi:hypothetical protein